LKTCQKLSMADVKTEADSTLALSNQSDIEKTYAGKKLKQTRNATNMNE